MAPTSLYLRIGAIFACCSLTSNGAQQGLSATQALSAMMEKAKSVRGSATWRRGVAIKGALNCEDWYLKALGLEWTNPCSEDAFLKSNPKPNENLCSSNAESSNTCTRKYCCTQDNLPGEVVPKEWYDEANKIFDEASKIDQETNAFDREQTAFDNAEAAGKKADAKITQEDTAIKQANDEETEANTKKTEANTKKTDAEKKKEPFDIIIAEQAATIKKAGDSIARATQARLEAQKKKEDAEKKKQDAEKKKQDAVKKKQAAVKNKEDAVKNKEKAEKKMRAALLPAQGSPAISLGELPPKPDLGRM